MITLTIVGADHRCTVRNTRKPGHERLAEGSGSLARSREGHPGRCWYYFLVDPDRRWPRYVLPYADYRTRSWLTGRLVYACGSGEHGQLGTGRTGEHIIAAGKTGFDIKDSPGQSIGIDSHVNRS
jgi:hypothetical protein